MDSKRKGMVCWWLKLLICSTLCAGCQEFRPDLHIAAASSTRYVLDEVIDKFEQTEGLRVDVSYSSSGKLTAQIGEGAPYGLFISADLRYPEQLVNLNLTSGHVIPYTTGKLIAWSTTIDSISKWSDLLGFRSIAIANPELAPYGIAAREALTHFKLWDEVVPNLVYGENAGQVNQFVLAGVAQVGFTAQSVLHTDKLPDAFFWKEVDQSSHRPIHQGLVILKGEQEKVASRFVAFIQSEHAQSIFRRFGYLSGEVSGR